MIKQVVLLVAAFIAVVAANEHSNEEVIKKINHMQNSWTAGHNEILARGEEYFKRLLGADLPEINSLPIRNDIELEENIPTTFDARKQWRKCASISSIKDQGHCGSCWAVSTAGAISDRVCISSNYKVRLNVSAENLMACCTDCVQEGKHGCDGGRIDYAWQYFQNSGLVTGGDYGSKEGCQPYEIPPANPLGSNDTPTPPCRRKCTNKGYRHPFGKDKHFGKSAFTLPRDVKKIQSEILKNGPVSAGFLVYEDFRYYKKGVYHRTSSVQLGGHAIRIIGWGREGGDDYWLIANSWGRKFGENGTFKIRRGTNECLIETFVAAGLTTK